MKVNNTVFLCQLYLLKNRYIGMNPLSPGGEIMDHPIFILLSFSLKGLSALA